MELYGLIGKKLSHSFSPAYFRQKFSDLNLVADYSLFEIDDISGFPEILKKNKNLKGLNVTIPYKRAIIPFLDEIDPVALELSSVNTIKINWQNDRPFLVGYNTDIIGFETSIKPLIAGKKNLSALIFGSGGSAQSVAYVLKKMGIDFHFVSRNKKGGAFLNYDELSEETLNQHLFIINTSPLGMFPDVDSTPAIDYNFIGKSHILYDLVYNPVETKFLKLGKLNGAVISNGQKMLEVQADEAWKIWINS